MVSSRRLRNAPCSSRGTHYLGGQRLVGWPEALYWRALRTGWQGAHAPPRSPHTCAHFIQIVSVCLDLDEALEFMQIFLYYVIYFLYTYLDREMDTFPGAIAGRLNLRS